MKTPIIMAAFGTTTKALETYEFMNAKLKAKFCDHPIIWSYGSRMVKDKLKKEKGIELKHPHEVLKDLSLQGQPWAVVQSMHMMCGHEFYRLVEEAGQSSVRTAIGLPLLYSPMDHMRAVRAMDSVFQGDDDEAVVLVGHGTDHASWTTYAAFGNFLRECYGKRAFVGVVEEFPPMDMTIEKVVRAGFKKVLLVPFLLVAGNHFYKDLIGMENSWQLGFEDKNIEVRLERKGLGFRSGIVDIFSKHIAAALKMAGEENRG